MNSLLNYGSDDDIDDSPDERSVDSYSYGLPAKNHRKPTTSQQPDDTNYDEVQMSLSEDSDAESKSPSRYGRDREDTKRGSPKYKDFSKEASRDRREDRFDKDRYSRDDKSRYKEDDRSKNRDDRDSRSRDDDRNRDRYREKDEDRHRERDEDRYRERDEDRLKDRKDDRRAKSRERYNSRDDRSRPDRDRRRSRSPRDSRDRRRSRSPRRSRSRSRERSGRGGFQRRFDRRNNKFDKNDPKFNQLVTEQSNDPQNKDRFFMPGITGRFRDQIEKRKLLWQKKGEETSTSSAAAPVRPPNAPQATKVWEGTTFAQDTDGKVANKFKRLMGIRTPGDGNKSASEVLKKQDEMFSAMEQQYEVARTTTHTMRGVGLGFGSFNR